MKALLLKFFLLNFIKLIQANDCECGVENIDVDDLNNYSSKIIGGDVVSENRYPWMVRVYADGSGVCGGAIINSRFILTAAHCVQPFKRFEVLIGTNDLTSGGTRMKVSKYRIHRMYNNESYDNDIALLMVDNEIKFSKTVRPVCLPDMNLKLSQVYVVAGWGYTKRFMNFNFKPSKQLMYTVVTEYPIITCMREWKNMPLMVSYRQICAADIDKDSCGGDSGGPLMQYSNGRVYAVGIVSFGRSACGTTRDSVYTRVNAYLYWIQKHTKIGKYCKNPDQFEINYFEKTKFEPK